MISGEGCTLQSIQFQKKKKNGKLGILCPCVYALVE